MRRARQIGVSALCLLVLAVAVGGATMWARGYRIYVIHTGSMVPTYVPGDIVVDAPAPRTVTPGEVITFRHTDLATDVVTHRVVGVTPAGLIRTKGDANQSVDAWQIRPDQVRGRTVFGVRDVGYVLVFLRQPTGLAALAAALCALTMLWSLCFPPEPVPGPADHGRRASSSHQRVARHRPTMPA